MKGNEKDLTIEGYCPICETDAIFTATGDSWYRGSLLCKSCLHTSVPRERALALVLSEIAPAWRDMDILESSPCDRGISKKLQNECKKYTGTHYFEDVSPGEIKNGFRNENLEKLTFTDNSFDLVISLDVMEHLFHPDVAFQEIYRVLRPGGKYICTFPINKNSVVPLFKRAILSDGKILHVEGLTPEYHGNPISAEGSLVTIDYGYDIHKMIGLWTPFDVRIIRFFDISHGIIGEYTEVIICRKIATNCRRRIYTPL